GIEWMHRRQYLNGWPEKSVVADCNPANVQHNAIEVEEHPLAKLDVGAVIAIEGRLHPDRLPAFSKKLRTKKPAYVLIPFAGSIQHLAQVARAISGRYQFRVQSVIKLACQHLVALTRHVRPPETAFANGLLPFRDQPRHLLVDSFSLK